MTKILEVQGAQSNTGCDKVAEEIRKEEARGEEVESLTGFDRQTEFQKLIKQPTN